MSIFWFCGKDIRYCSYWNQWECITVYPSWLNEQAFPSFWRGLKGKECSCVFLTLQQWELYKICCYYLLPGIRSILCFSCKGFTIMNNFPWSMNPAQNSSSAFNHNRRKCQTYLTPFSWSLCCVWEESEWRHKDKANLNTSECLWTLELRNKGNSTPKVQASSCCSNSNPFCEKQIQLIMKLFVYSHGHLPVLQQLQHAAKLPRPYRVDRITGIFLLIVICCQQPTVYFFHAYCSL